MQEHAGISRSTRACRAPKFSVVHLWMLAKSTSAAAPRRTRHARSAISALFGGSGDGLLRQAIQINLPFLDISEFLEVSPIQRRDAGASHCPQGLQLASILCLACCSTSRNPSRSTSLAF